MRPTTARAIRPPTVRAERGAVVAGTPSTSGKAPHNAPPRAGSHRCDAAAPHRSEGLPAVAGPAWPAGHGATAGVSHRSHALDPTEGHRLGHPKCSCIQSPTTDPGGTMRFDENSGKAAKSCILALAVMVSTAVGASAQLLVDGTILYNNNASGTLAGQFSGSSVSGACSGLTAVQLFTVTYPHNGYADPLLDANTVGHVTNAFPVWQPAAGSPAFGNAVTVPAGFEQTCFKGAIGGAPGDDWTLGWTYYDSTGANRQDLHLPGMPAPRPLAVYDNVAIKGHRTWSPDSNYEVRGQLRIK